MLEDLAHVQIEVRGYVCSTFHAMCVFVKCVKKRRWQNM